MPAPNCGSSPDDSQSNMNISDEDGEDLPSKISPATHHLTLKRGHVRETTAPPRTKKKLSDSVEEGNIFDRASSSPSKDSTSDPPVKKAKLLNASSASCGEALSQNVNSKVSLKRAASTDSEDEVSSDGSKTDIFKERDDGDKARCIRQYSNRVKGKRKAEELPSAAQEKNQDSSAATTGTVQMDHDYGRASDTVTTQSLDDGYLIWKEKNNQFVNQESLVHSTQSQSNEFLVSAAKSLKSVTEVQCAIGKTQYNSNSIVNEAPTSHREISDFMAFSQNDYVTPTAASNDNDNVAESIKSQKENEIQILLSGTHNSSTTESNPGCREEPQAGERATSDHTGQTSVCSGTENTDTTKNSANHSEEITTSSVGYLESQMDQSSKDLKSKPLEHHVSQDVPDTTTGFDSENRIVYNTEESQRKDIWSSSTPILAVPASVADVRDKRTDSTSKDVEDVGKQNKKESILESEIDTNRQPDSAQKEDLQINKSYQCTDHAAEVTEETDHEQAFSPSTHIKMDAKASGTLQQNVSNGADTVETITVSNECSVINSTVERQQNVNLENVSGLKSCVTAETERFIPECALEQQRKNREQTDEADKDVSAGDHCMASEHPETRNEVMHESSIPDTNNYAIDRCDKAHNIPIVCQSNEHRRTAEADMQTGSDNTSNTAATSETQELTQLPEVQTLEDHGREKLVHTEYSSLTKIQPEIEFQTMLDSEKIYNPTEVSEVAVPKEFTVATHECEEDKETCMSVCESSAGIQEDDQVEANPEVISSIETQKSIGINIRQDQEEDVDGDVTTGECVFFQMAHMKTKPMQTENFQSCENLVASDLEKESGRNVMSECEGKKDDVNDPQLQMDIDNLSTVDRKSSVASYAAEVESHQSHDITSLDREVQETPVNESFEMKYTTLDIADSLRKIGTAAEEGETSYQQSTVNAQSSHNLEISDLSTDAQQDPVSESEQSKTDENKMAREECDSVTETHMERAAAEGVLDSPRMEGKNLKSTNISEVDTGVHQDLESKGDEVNKKTEFADMQEVMMSKPEEISSFSVEIQSCRSIEMTEIQTEGVSESYSAKVDENVLVAAYISLPEPQMSTEDSETPEEITTTVDGEDQRSLETSDESPTNNAVKESDKMDADCINIPEVQKSAPPEETTNPSLTEIQSCGQVEMVELDKDVDDQVDYQVEKNPSTTEHVDDPEPQMNIEATTSPEKIPYPPPTIERPSRENTEIMGSSSDVSEPTDNCFAESVVLPECNSMDAASTEPVQSVVETSQLSMEFKTDLLKESSESKTNEDGFDAVNVNLPDLPGKTDAPEEILSQLTTLETGGEVCELATEVQNNVVSGSLETKLDKDSCNAESDDVPEAPVETAAAQGQISNVTSAVEQECQESICEHPNALLFDINNSSAVATSENQRNVESGEENMQVDVDKICGSREGFDSALEEEDKMQITQADEAPVIISTDQPDAGYKEGTEQGEVMLLVFDSGEAAPASEEQLQMIPQPQEEIQADQVVYEPISSPESSDDREVPAASQNHIGFSVLGMEETIVEGCSSAEGNETVGIQVENNMEPQSQVPDSQQEKMRGTSLDEAEGCSSPEAEQSVHIKQVAVISSSDDIRIHEGQPEGTVERSENNSYPDDSSVAESSEVVQKIAGHQEGTDITMTETAATTMFAIPDSTSEEYVILEPIPQSEVSFDIVTQAAAESGLSVPFTAQVNPGVTLEGDVINGSQVMVLSEVEVPQSEALDTAEALNQKMITPLECVVQNSDHHQQPIAETMNVDISETDRTNSNTQKTSQHCVASAMDTKEENLGLQEVQILEDMEIGREVVLTEEDNEEDGDVSIVERPQEKETIPPKMSEVKLDEKNKEESSESKVKPNSTAESVEGDKKEPEDIKPKKQQMNTQARTKARLAALAEQKAAAARKSANRHQLNLLALCQEIAEDIETDSMLLKKIEEEKQAAAAAAAVADMATKNESSEESPLANTPANTDPAHASPSVDPEVSMTPTNEESLIQPSSADVAEAKPAEEPPKRRFFISQVTVPLKAHEKKKLTRYQRLRQVELQREKMSWARVKKLKSDQANQMFSDIDWQEPLNVFSQFSMNPIAKAPLPVASPAKTPLPSVPSTSKSEVLNKDVSNIETPKDEPIRTEPIKTEPIKMEPIKTEPIQTEPIKTEPNKTETTKTEPTETEETKSSPVKTEATKSGPPHTEVRRSTRQTKAQASKETPSPGPSQKVTRSAAKKKLPAVPPPMPNGLNAQKQTPVEYKPYRPKPKYSFEDFELDDDPVPAATAKPSPQQTRANLQPFPTAQSKPAVPAQPFNQAILKTRIIPAGQDSSSSVSAVATKPTPDTPATAAGSSKASLSAKPLLKPSALSTPPSTGVSALGRSGPADSHLLNPDSSGDAAHSSQSTPTPAMAEKALKPPSAENSSKVTRLLSCNTELKQNGNTE